METPLVTAVMITGKDPARLPLALAAVRSYQRQSYPNRELLIVTDGFSVWDHLPKTDDSIREVTVHKASLGELRNVGLVEARGAFIYQADDDDWSGERRMELQLAAALKHPGAAITLRRQVRYSFGTGSACVATLEPHLGIPGTILHPVTPLRYPAMGKHEDSHFLKSFPQIHVLDTPPETYLRFYTGLNTWDEQHVMGRLSKQEAQIRLPPAAKRYLASILDREYRDFRSTPV